MSIKKKLYFKVGTVIELDDGSKARVTENDDYQRCVACVLSELSCGSIACYPGDRKDGKKVYFEQVKEGGKA
jgi:hypothetical protein